MNNYEAYMESFSHLRLNYALVTTCKSQWLTTMKVYFSLKLCVHRWWQREERWWNHELAL